ncbi:Pycsar system effector family protein [Flavobacterium sp. J27]|uniref:Pycsar system effector family protein n=1 Tax=Flavobacterium sp. J27 TaxID=2060419 RepID=UPI001F0E406E|nr:Pycsar system effector family protein [Flavobacterium sp. J27]
MILNDVELYIVDFFNKKLPAENYYHNLVHTKSVVELVKILAIEEECTEDELLLLLIAAWFHDVGYVEKAEGHEDVSVRIALEFLKEKGLSRYQLDKIKELIRVTKISSPPNNLLGKIMKDADSGHVSFEEYFEVSEKLRKEISFKKRVEIDPLDWLEQNKKFLEDHLFFTDYAQKNWQFKKEENKKRVQQKIDEIKSKANKRKQVKTGRGVETLFRVQLKNHIQLSAIADTKANILLSVNAIIISIALSNLIPKLDSPSNAFLVLPTFILMVFSVASVVLSVLSTRPKVSNVRVTQEMITNKQANILFFGNFCKMSLNEFEWGINYLIENEDVLYNSLTKDFYFLGLVLERKYKLLRITYTVFMIGIVVSALAFIISYNLIISK